MFAFCFFGACFFFLCWGFRNGPRMSKLVFEVVEVSTTTDFLPNAYTSHNSGSGDNPSQNFN